MTVKPMRISLWKNEIYDRKEEYKRSGSSLIESGEMYQKIFATENALTETYRYFIGEPPEGKIKRTDKGLCKLISFLAKEERNKILELIEKNSDIKAYYNQSYNEYFK